MKLAWLFPGQGTQKVGMGKDLYDASPAAKQAFETADAALGFSLTTLCFTGPQEELTLTANAQPAILATSIATLAAIRESIPDFPAPSFAAGHSLGEYSALVAAGALDFVDALKLVRLRGQSMQQAVPEGQGAMAAIMGADPAQVQALCDDARKDGVLSPANFNAPGQIVIAGTAEAVERARELASARKLKAIPLKVSAPFHCKLMAPAAAAVQFALKGTSISPLSFPVVSNFEATPNQDPLQVASLLVKQVDGSVRWEQSITCMAAAGVTHAIEIGPGTVLAGLARKIDKTIQVISISDLAGIQALPAWLRAA